MFLISKKMISDIERKLWLDNCREITAADLKKFGVTVVIAPHPDDESLGCGGTISLLRQAGQRVYVIFVSDGSKSHPNSLKYPAEKLRQLREAEAKQALQRLGLPELNAVFMRLKDGAVPTTGEPGFEQAVHAMLIELNQIQPDTILVTWENDFHRDHRAAFQLMQTAVKRLNYQPRILQYLIWLWELGTKQDFENSNDYLWFKVDITPVETQKWQAINCHQSQLSTLINDDPGGFMLSPEVLNHFRYAEEIFIEKKQIP